MRNHSKEKGNSVINTKIINQINYCRCSIYLKEIVFFGSNFGVHVRFVLLGHQPLSDLWTALFRISR